MNDVRVVIRVRTDSWVKISLFQEVPNIIDHETVDNLSNVPYLLVLEKLVIPRVIPAVVLSIPILVLALLHFVFLNVEIVALSFDIPVLLLAPECQNEFI